MRGEERVCGGHTQTSVDQKGTLATGASKHRWIAPCHRRAPLEEISEDTLSLCLVTLLSFKNTKQIKSEWEWRHGL